jgi:enoyl-CoA hydratase/carnithine racemase
MLACDIVIARDDAQFGTPEVNVGLWPMMIGALIYRNMLPKHATPMIMLGDRIGVEEAYRMGFVSLIAAAADYSATVQAVTKKLSRKSPIGMRLGKQAFAAVADMSFEEAVHYLSTQHTAVSETADAREGIAAFLARRDPHFIGK